MFVSVFGAIPLSPPVGAPTATTDINKCSRFEYTNGAAFSNVAANGESDHCAFVSNPPVENIVSGEYDTPSYIKKDVAFVCGKLLVSVGSYAYAPAIKFPNVVS